MSSFLEIIRMHFKVFIQYKWSFAITLIIQPIVLLIHIALFTSIYKYNHAQFIKGYSLDQMIWYFTTINFIYVFIWNFTDARISDKILSGDLTVDLIRPVSLFRFELANAIALRIVGVLFEFIPGIVLYSVIFFPRFLTIASLGKFILLATVAFLMYYLFNYLLGLSAFLIKSNSSIINIRVTLMSIIGGAVIPLEFLPDWLNKIFDFLPFKYMFYWPVQFFLNKASVSGFTQLAYIFLMQLLWVVIMYLLCKFLWRKAVTKYGAVGG